MTREDEIAVVKKALVVETELQKLRMECAEIEEEEFPTMRDTPVFDADKVEKIDYPDVKIGFKWRWLLLILIPGVGWCILIGLIVYKEYKKRNYKNSEKYKKQCVEIDSLNNEKMKEAQIWFEREMEAYNKELIEHEAKYAEWKQNQTRQIELKKANIDNISNQLDSFYQTTMLIPKKYHSAFALEHIYNIFAYSQYSFKECAQDYEIFLNRKIAEARFQEEQEIRELLSELVTINDALVTRTEAINHTFESYVTRETIAEITKVAQAHNLNKILSKLKR